MNMFYLHLILTIFSFVSSINIHSQGRYVSIRCDKLTYFDRNKVEGDIVKWNADYIEKELNYFSIDPTFPPYYEFIKSRICNIIQGCLSSVAIEDNDLYYLNKKNEKCWNYKKVENAFCGKISKINLPILKICVVNSEGLSKEGKFVFQMELKDNISIEELKNCFDFKVYYLDKNGRELNNEQKAAYIKYIKSKGNKNSQSFMSEDTLKDYFFRGFFSVVPNDKIEDEIRHGIYSGISVNYAYNKDIASEIKKTVVEVELNKESKKIVVSLKYQLKNNAYNRHVYVKDNRPLLRNNRTEIFKPDYYEYYVDDIEYITADIKSKGWEGINNIGLVKVPQKEVLIYSKYKNFSQEDESNYRDIINNYNNAREIRVNGRNPQYEDFLNNEIDHKKEQDIVDKLVKVILDYVNKQDLVKIKFFDDILGRLNTAIYDNSVVYLKNYIDAYCLKYILNEIQNMSINRDILLDIVNLKELKVKEDELFKNTKANSLMGFLKEVEGEVKKSNKLLLDNWNTIISVIVTKGESNSLAYLFNIRVINDSKYIYKFLLNTIKEHLVHFYIKFEEAPEGKKLKSQYDKLLSRQQFSVLLPVENKFKDEIFVKYFNKMLGEESCLDVKNIDKIYEDNFFKTPADKPLNGQTYILKFKSNVYEDINKNNNATPVDNKPRIEPIPKLKEIKLNNDAKGTNDTKGTAKLDTSKINEISEINEIKKPVVITDIKNNTLDTPRPLPKIAKETLITKTPVESSDIKKTEVIKEIRDTKKTGDVEGSKEGRGTKKTKYGKNKTPSTPSSIDDKKPCCCNKCCCKCCQTRG